MLQLLLLLLLSWAMHFCSYGADATNTLRQQGLSYNTMFVESYYQIGDNLDFHSIFPEAVPVPDKSASAAWPIVCRQLASVGCPIFTESDVFEPRPLALRIIMCCTDGGIDQIDQRDQAKEFVKPKRRTLVFDVTCFHHSGSNGVKRSITLSDGLQIYL